MKLLRAPALLTTTQFTVQLLSNTALFGIHKHISHHLTVRTAAFHYISVAPLHWSPYNITPTSPLQYHSLGIITTYT